jgi:hypothetical protein
MKTTHSLLALTICFAYAFLPAHTFAYTPCFDEDVYPDYEYGYSQGYADHLASGGIEGDYSCDYDIDVIDIIRLVSSVLGLSEIGPCWTDCASAESCNGWQTNPNIPIEDQECCENDPSDEYNMGYAEGQSDASAQSGVLGDHNSDGNVNVADVVGFVYDFLGLGEESASTEPEVCISRPTSDTPLCEGYAYWTEGAEPVCCSQYGDLHSMCVYGNHCWCSANFVCEDTLQGGECMPEVSCVPAPL